LPIGYLWAALQLCKWAGSGSEDIGGDDFCSLHTQHGQLVDVKMDERQRGTVESYPDVYAPLKQLGIPANVSDEVLEEVFHEPFGTLALRFGNFCLNLKSGRWIILGLMGSAIMITCVAY
jgi:hypothetical protein